MPAGPASFLDAVARYDAGADGRRVAAAAPRADGRGLPAGGPGGFAFATGVECSYPTIRNGRVRRDQLAECQHYERWREDFALVRDLGLRVLRYGLPYYRTHLGPGRYDWGFADEVLPALRDLGIMPILDLLHFGVPDWIGDFQNPELPVHFAAYAGAVAERYPWVRHYTPVNEIYVTARASALDGIWNEQLKTDAGFVTALKHACAASILASDAIAARRPDAVIVQSESAEYVHEVRATPTPAVTLVNQRRFLALDCLYRHPSDADAMLYLLDGGLTRAEYAWFLAHEPAGYQVMGNDYYGRNEQMLLPDGSRRAAEDVLGWAQITKAYWDRYRRPVMHTETNVFDADQAPTWLWKQWVNVMTARAAGVPVFGFTWYSLTDQVDWDTSLAEQNGRVNACGLYDLDRKPRPVAAAYRQLLEEFGRIALVPHGELLAITGQPATLKVEV